MIYTQPPEFNVIANIDNNINLLFTALISLLSQLAKICFVSSTCFLNLLFDSYALEAANLVDMVNEGSLLMIVHMASSKT